MHRMKREKLIIENSRDNGTYLLSIIDPTVSGLNYPVVVRRQNDISMIFILYAAREQQIILSQLLQMAVIAILHPVETSFTMSNILSRVIEEYNSILRKRASAQDVTFLFSNLNIVRK